MELLEKRKLEQRAEAGLHLRDTPENTNTTNFNQVRKQRPATIVRAKPIRPTFNLNSDLPPV